MLWEHLATSANPLQEFLDSCINDPLVDLDLEESQPTWDMDMEVMAINTLAPLGSEADKLLDNIATLTKNTLLSHQDQMIHVPVLSLSLEPSEQPRRVHIPKAPTDTKETPHPSPRMRIPVLASLQRSALTTHVALSQPNTVLRILHKTFKDHKQALQKLEEEYDMEGEGSNDSDAKEDSEIVIAEVKKYFAGQLDLANRYSNPKADNVQCPTCNSLLSRTVFDIYQHIRTSRSKHNLLHRGVAAPIAALFGNQDPL